MSTSIDDKNNNKGKGLKLIAAGLSRNGTFTLKKAFEILGYKKCYHYFEFFENPEHAKYWDQVVDNNDTDWDELFDGYDCAADVPVVTYIENIIKKYPDVKVILNTRDPESWYNSCKNTIFSNEFDFYKNFPWIKKTDMHIEFLNDFNADNKEAALKFYNNHNAKIRNLIKKENLLDNYNVKDGWKPICDFLKVDVPKIDFPCKNDSNNFFENLIEISERVNKKLNNNS